ncbi:MAG TPA: aspartate kinase [Terriglobales bacterium]|nr:aspartate kinase [Terriglobales bacterium]
MLVMKFGGTSVECAESISRVAEIVRHRQHMQPVVVVSALARITDQLQSLGALSKAGKLDEALRLLDGMEKRHAEVAHSLLDEKSAQVLAGLKPMFEEVAALLGAIAAIGELSPRTSDRLLSFGERWSSVLVSEALRERHLPAVFVDACQVIVTDDDHTHAAPVMDLIATRVESQVKPLVKKSFIPIMGGFIGATQEGVVTTLGRGGSDFTASIVGAALQAERIEIWTDVNGMMTTDPRVCPDAQNIDSISFEEAAELAHFGAKVLHPKTLQPAVERGIPVYVLNSRHPENRGTRVETVNSDGEPRVRSIACKRGIRLAEVCAKQGLDAKLTSSIFAIAEQQDCLVDLAAVSRSNLALLLTSPQSAELLSKSLDGVASLKVTENVALVSVVGRNVARDPVISACALSALSGLPVKMIFHGASDMNLSFVVDEAQADEAVRRMHRVMFPAPVSDPAAEIVQQESFRLPFLQVAEA